MHEVYLRRADGHEYAVKSVQQFQQLAYVSQGEEGGAQLSVALWWNVEALEEEERAELCAMVPMLDELVLYRAWPKAEGEARQVVFRGLAREVASDSETITLRATGHPDNSAWGDDGYPPLSKDPVVPEP